MVDWALEALHERFDELYGEGGRPPIAPQRLRRAQLLMLLYPIRSERMLAEQLRYDLLFRWFVGLGMNEVIWHATVFTKKRHRLLAGKVAREFFVAVVRQAKRRGLMSSEDFPVDRRTVRQQGYESSQRARKRVEQGFGWMKTVAGLRKARWWGCEKAGWMVTLAAAAYNLVRMRDLLAATT